MKVLFDARALDDLENIYRWIAEESPDAARSVDARIRVSIRRLEQFPLRGRVGVVDGSRELIIRQLPYIVIYQVRWISGEIVIRQVVHAARERPRSR